MLDAPVRKVLAPVLDRAGGALADAGVPAGALTASGFAAGMATCVAAAERHWTTALVLWLVNRLLDGLDGPVARRVGVTERGGFLDIVADFAVYAGVVLAVGIAVPDARMGCLALLVAYYLSGTAFLALSSLLEKQRAAEDRPYDDGRSLRFVGGLAEGTETVLAYVVLFLIPSHATAVVWTFTAVVALTALQRVVVGAWLLDPTGARSPGAATLDRKTSDARSSP